MNKVILQGRLTKDVELKRTKSNKAVANVSIAVVKGKDSMGNYISDFFNVTCWEGVAEKLVNEAGKGFMVEVYGKLETNSYTNQQGFKVYTTYVVADFIKVIAKPKDYSNFGGDRANSYSDSFGEDVPWGD